MIEHGIFQDQSDIRVHVCPVTKMLYIMHTKQLREHLKQFGKNYRTYESATSVGILLPIEKIVTEKWVKSFKPNDSYWSDLPDGESTIVKGKWGERLVKKLVRSGKIQLWLEAEIIEDKEEQLNGNDIELPRTTISVKFDKKGGEREEGGSGNLYMEVKERNPNKLF